MRTGARSSVDVCAALTGYRARSPAALRPRLVGARASEIASRELFEALCASDDTADRVAHVRPLRLTVRLCSHA